MCVWFVFVTVFVHSANVLTLLWVSLQAGSTFHICSLEKLDVVMRIFSWSLHTPVCFVPVAVGIVMKLKEIKEPGVSTGASCFVWRVMGMFHQLPL